MNMCLDLRHKIYTQKCWPLQQLCRSGRTLSHCGFDARISAVCIPKSVQEDADHCDLYTGAEEHYHIVVLTKTLVRPASLRLFKNKMLTSQAHMLMVKPGMDAAEAVDM